MPVFNFSPASTSGVKRKENLEPDATAKKTKISPDKQQIDPLSFFASKKIEQKKSVNYQKTLEKKEAEKPIVCVCKSG